MSRESNCRGSRKADGEGGIEEALQGREDQEAQRTDERVKEGDQNRFKRGDTAGGGGDDVTVWTEVKGQCKRMIRGCAWNGLTSKLSAGSLAGERLQKEACDALETRRHEGRGVNRAGVSVAGPGCTQSNYRTGEHG